MDSKDIDNLSYLSRKALDNFMERVERCTRDNPDLPVEMVKELLLSDWDDLSDVTQFIAG